MAVYQKVTPKAASRVYALGFGRPHVRMNNYQLAFTWIRVPRCFFVIACVHEEAFTLR